MKQRELVTNVGIQVPQTMDPESRTLNPRNRRRGIQAPVPERPIRANPGLKILFFFYLPSYALCSVKFYAIITESRSKDTKVFCKLE